MSENNKATLPASPEEAGGVAAFIFDLGGVLIDLDMTGTQRACSQLGIAPETLFVKSTGKAGGSTVCQGITTSQMVTGYQVGAVRTEQFLDAMMRCCAPGITRQTLIDAWNSCLKTIPQERLDMILRLRQQGFRTYLLSNTNDLHWQYVLEHCLSEEGRTADDLFDGVFLSHEVHLVKPDAAIYRHVIQQIGLPAEQCLFIDDAKENAEAACREGICGKWLDLQKEDVCSLVNQCLVHNSLSIKH